MRIQGAGPYGFGNWSCHAFGNRCGRASTATIPSQVSNAELEEISHNFKLTPFYQCTSIYPGQWLKNVFAESSNKGRQTLLCDQKWRDAVTRDYLKLPLLQLCLIHPMVIRFFLFISAYLHQAIDVYKRQRTTHCCGLSLQRLSHCRSHLPTWEYAFGSTWSTPG